MMHLFVIHKAGLKSSELNNCKKNGKMNPNLYVCNHKKSIKNISPVHRGKKSSRGNVSLCCSDVSFEVFVAIWHEHNDARRESEMETHAYPPLAFCQLLVYGVLSKFCIKKSTQRLADSSRVR